MSHTFDRLTVIDHPLVRHKLSVIRDKNTSGILFRQGIKELTLFEAYEATKHIRTHSVAIETPMAQTTCESIAGQEPIIVPILRAGLGMLDAMLELIPTAPVAHLGMYRDEVTHKPIEYYAKMPAYIAEWKKMDLRFDGIQIGFLGSHQQISVVLDFIRSFRSDGTLVLVDPVMGDNGKPYALYDENMQLAMRQLAMKADILTPNLTEACILTSTPYHSLGWTKAELFDLAGKLTALGAQKVVISGVPMGQYLGNVLLEKGGQPRARLVAVMRDFAACV